MSEQKHVSPLLDGFALGDPLSEHDGVRCCPAIKENSDNKYIVKIITVPAAQAQIDALLLAGAYKDPADAMDYFQRVAEDIIQEAQFLKDLSRLDGFLSYENWQMEPITRRRLGYEVYLVGSYKLSLDKYVRRNPMTHLEAINLSLDICSALTVCRQAGALYVDLKPGNIFISDNKTYKIGDLGFIRLDALSYTALPNKYHSSYTPPELSDPMASVNMTTDTYALGMILYQLYNEGNLPADMESSGEPIPAPVNADYELAEIILKAIHPDYTHRWQDPEQMAQALIAYMQRNAVNNVPITPYTPIDTDIQNVQIPREPEPEIPVKETAAEPSDTARAEAEDISESEHHQTAESEAQTQEALPAEPEAPIDELKEESADSPADVISDNEIEDNRQTAAESPVKLESQEFIPSEPEKSQSHDFSFSNESLHTAAGAQISEELSRIFAKADDLIAHETPAGVVLPEIPEQPDPFAFATEDSIEAADLKTPFDPVMEDTGGQTALKTKKEKKFLSPERKKKIRRIFTNLLLVLLLAGVCAGGFWFYQNIYIQSIDSLQITGDRDSVRVIIRSEADETLLKVTCADNYGNISTSAVTDGEASFTGLLSNTMYTVTVDIDGFHSLAGQTSEVFTTATTTEIVAFSAITGPEDGSAVLNFTVDGDEPRKWNVVYSTEGEEPRNLRFEGHTVTVEDLTVGKLYTFTLDAGKDLSLSGNTSVPFMASRLILAENLSVTTTTGTDITIHWTAPGDTIVENWKVRCYNEAGYEKTDTVTETEICFTGIDPSMGYNIEVTAAGMTQPARSSITANPINITQLKVEEESQDKLQLQWEYAGADPNGGWLLMYRIDGNTELNVIKCEKASAQITPRIPGAYYQFIIQAVDGTSVFGNVHTYTCADAPGFDANGVTEADITPYLLKTPEDPNWSYEKISSDDFTDTFVSGEPISIVLYGKPDFYVPGKEVKMLYVIRDAYGNVLPEYISEATENWRQIWQSGSYHYGELDLSNAPKVPGNYRLNIYMDGASVAQTIFNITQ